MGKDNQPKHRQVRELRRKQGRRAPYDRVLIVTEGEKTEPNYVREIRAEYRLHTAHVQVRPGALGTQPLQVVEYAERLLIYGDRDLAVQPRAFEQVYAVFDRDDHPTYDQALDKAGLLDRCHLNDEGQPVAFNAVPSVPCFELWLLLHFEDVLAPLHRTQAQQRVRQHLAGYEKGQIGHWHSTRERIEDAVNRATVLALANNPRDGRAPYTGMHILVHRVKALRSD